MAEKIESSGHSKITKDQTPKLSIMDLFWERYLRSDGGVGASILTELMFEIGLARGRAMQAESNPQGSQDDQRRQIALKQNFPIT